MDLVTLYANKVLSGEIIAGELVNLACQRHLNDLKRIGGDDFPYIFDVNRCNKYLDFFKLLRHSKGALAGMPISLELWQCFRIGSVFGWVHKDTKLRRFYESYNQVARKNGKSTEAAGIGIECLSIDNELGAEVYSAATKRDQARIIFDEAVRMVRKSPSLTKYIDVFRSNMNMPLTASKFEPLSADANSLDGLNIHCGIIDELHAHKTRDVFDVIQTATGARLQPLIWIVTTAGFNTNGICYEKYEYAIKVLKGVIDDDAFFCYIAQPDDGDDPFSENTWFKANPNLNVSVNIDDLRKKAKQAKEQPRALNNFLVKHLNLWTNANDAWMNMLKYNACESYHADFNVNILLGMPCYVGVDLSTTTDLTSVNLEFKLDSGDYVWLNHVFIPAEDIDERSRRDHMDYRTLERLGYVTLTEGSVIDYDYIHTYILEMSKLYDIKEICYDPWNATQFANNLMNDGFTCVEIRQGFRTMSEPTKDVEKLVYNKQLITLNNPLLKWCFSNAVVRSDPAGNVKLDKSKSTHRIDPAIAGVTSHVRCMMQKNTTPDVNVWNFKRG